MTQVRARPLKLPKHFSVSSLKTYRECPKRYQLQRIIATPETPSWWFVNGHSLHAATEIIDREMPVYNRKTAEGFDLVGIWTEAFNEEVAARLMDEPDMNKWNCRSRAKKPPTGEQNYRSEYDMGIGWFVDYLNWRAKNPDLVITHIEEELFEPMEGSPLPLKGYVDRIGVWETSDELVLYDIKSGSTLVKDPIQLGTYRVGVYKKLGLDVRKGNYYQSKYAGFAEPYDLTSWTEDLVSSYAREWFEDIEAGRFLPHLQDGCFRCPFKSYCYLKSGDNAKTRLDPLNPHFKGYSDVRQ